MARRLVQDDPVSGVFAISHLKGWICKYNEWPDQYCTGCSQWSPGAAGDLRLTESRVEDCSPGITPSVVESRGSQNRPRHGNWRMTAYVWNQSAPYLKEGPNGSRMQHSKYWRMYINATYNSENECDLLHSAIPSNPSTAAVWIHGSIHAAIAFG